VLADDHELVRIGLAALLASAADLEVVGQAADGREAVRLVLELAPDVVVMDLTMPVLDGVGATRLVREHRPETGVLILTATPNSEMIAAALSAGAVGYLFKDVEPERLVGAVRGAAGRDFT
jgi:DNA-binding NarL/FixJ family response regulator